MDHSQELTILHFNDVVRLSRECITKALKLTPTVPHIQPQPDRTVRYYIHHLPECTFAL